MTQTDMFGTTPAMLGSNLPPRGLRFSGDTFDPALDSQRLTGQWLRVWSLMQDGRYRTLAEIHEATGCPEASVSARLRDFRKARFGAHAVERRRRGDPRAGLWEYRIAN